MGKLQGREDIPMNTAGIGQIKEAAEYLKKFNWKVIITSPLSRTKDSAKIISKEIGNIKIYEEADFIERDCGEASGMTLDERKTLFPDGKWNGRESDEILQNRTVNALLKHAKKYEGNDMIIVSHRAAIDSMLAYISNNKTGAGIPRSRNACMTLLEKAGDKIEIVFFNKLANELI
jgi:uncharacterized phosphatase